MPRKPPSRLPPARTAQFSGIPAAALWVLNRQKRIEICSYQVADALQAWRRFSRLPLGPPTWERDPVTAQDLLERSHAVPRGTACAFVTTSR